ncbi:Uncharacterized protein ToN1_43170 [Aromatoleum petrolei]|nr:Uncharacterized protein ToN1_43170 [Aromatoleum petrolei]
MTHSPRHLACALDISSAHAAFKRQDAAQLNHESRGETES